MRILVVGRDDGGRRQVATALQAAGHVVTAAQDERSLGTASAAQSPQVVLLTVPGVAEDTLDLIQRIRDGIRTPATHLLLVAGELTESRAIQAYEAGIDGDIRGSCEPAYLLARVAAVQRRLEPGERRPKANAPHSPAAGAATKNGAARAAAAGSPLDLVGQTPAWRTAPENLRLGASKFLTLGATVMEAPPPDVPLSGACSILLANVEHELELRVAVGADAKSAASLAVHLFGPDSEELAPDMLSELSNIFMGGLKTAFGTDALSFTGGLPEVIASEHVLRPTVTYRLQEAFALSLLDAQVVVHLGVRCKSNLMLLPAELREGMVLAKDTLNARGLLLMKGGTRLSQTMVTKLQGLLPPKTPLEVTAP